MSIYGTLMVNGLLQSVHVLPLLFRMDSIDVYLTKKRKRSEDAKQRKEGAKNVTQAAMESIKKMKLAHNTPNANNAPVSQIEDDKSASKRLSFKSPAFRPTTLHIDSNISFNFKSKLQSPKPFKRTSPRLHNVDKVKHTTSTNRKSVRTSPRLQVLSDKTNRQSTGDRSKPEVKKSTPSITRKSVHFTSSVKKSNAVNNRLTICDFRPAGLSTASPARKTPVKFDLQASLKKSLSYKPHKGKLKPYDAPVLFTEGNAKQRVALKSRRDLTTREKRRATVVAHRQGRKTSIISRRRGVES